MSWQRIDQQAPPIGRPVLVRTVEDSKPRIAFLSPEAIWYAGGALVQSSATLLGATPIEWCEPHGIGLGPLIDPPFGVRNARYPRRGLAIMPLELCEAFGTDRLGDCGRLFATTVAFPPGELGRPAIPICGVFADD